MPHRVAVIVLLLWAGSAHAATVTITAPDAVVETKLDFGCRYVGMGKCPTGTPSERLEALREIWTPEAQVTVVWEDPAFDTWRDKDGVKP